MKNDELEQLKEFRDALEREPTKEQDFVDVRELPSRNLKYAYSGVLLISDDGEELGICNRDSGFEFQYNDIWYEAKEGIVKPLGTTKEAPVDKIREAFHKWASEDGLSKDETDFSDSISFKNAIDRMMACGFYAGHKSQQAEIERLKAENEAMRCCGNCSYSSDDQPVQSKSECKLCFRRIGFEAEISDFKDNWKPKDITK